MACAAPTFAADNTSGYNAYKVTGGEYLTLTSILPSEQVRKISAKDHMAVTADGRLCDISANSSTCMETALSGQNGTIVDYSGGMALTSSMQIIPVGGGTKLTAPAGTVQISAVDDETLMLARTNAGDVYTLDGGTTKKLYDHSKNGPATDILATYNNDLPLYLAGGHLYGNTQDFTPTNITFGDHFTIEGKSVTIAGNTTAYLPDTQGRTWTIQPTEYNPITNNKPAGGYSKPGIPSAVKIARIDNDNVLRATASGNPVDGRRFVAITEDDAGNTYALEDTNFKHSETTTVGALPQSGDPAAAWWQNLSYLTALTMIGLAVAIVFHRRSTRY